MLTRQEVGRGRGRGQEHDSEAKVEAEANSHEAKANSHEAETEAEAKIALFFQPNFTVCPMHFLKKKTKPSVDFRGELKHFGSKLVFTWELY